MAANKIHLDPPQFINSQDGLLEAARRLKSENRLAVDTEANSLYAYHERVCLIQISTPTRDFIIDTLALDDLSLLREIFMDQHIEKIFHASEYDILIMHDDFGFEYETYFTKFDYYFSDSGSNFIGYKVEKKKFFERSLVGNKINIENNVIRCFMNDTNECVLQLLIHPMRWRI